MPVDTSLTAREAYCAVLATGPLLKADAVVVLAGEDAGPRVDVAVELFRQSGGVRMIVTGGRDEPPRWQGAARLLPSLLGKGVAPGLVETDEAANTWEQAGHVAALAKEHGWKRVLVAVSPYHQYRAHLTFVAALRKAGMEETLHVLMVPAGQTSWHEAPDGMEETRLELLESELQKCEEYHAKGHVASWQEGLDYLRYWEGR